MPRPRIAKAEDKRRRVVGVRFTDAEKARAEQLAAAAGVALSDFARQRILSGQVVVKQATAALPAADFRELNRIGVNLAQVLKVLHFAKADGHPPALARELEAQLHSLSDLRDQIAAILARGGGDESGD